MCGESLVDQDVLLKPTDAWETPTAHNSRTYRETQIRVLTAGSFGLDSPGKD